MWFNQAIQLLKSTLALSVTAALMLATSLGLEKPPAQEIGALSAYHIEGQLRKEQERIPILMYHDISEQSSRWNASTVSPEQFKEDMLLLKSMGYTTIHFGEYFDSLEGKGTLPLNPVIVTFDDGYTSNYTYAFPILKQLNMKATIFVVGWSVGLIDYMPGQRLAEAFKPHFSWAQAKEMYDSGVMDIQHHTYDLHQERSISLGTGRKVGIGVAKYLREPQLSYEKRFAADVLKGKALIESQIGNQVRYFAYPYGVYNVTTERILKQLGFKATLTVRPGISSLSSPYALMRINAKASEQSGDLMRSILEAQNQPVTIELGSGDRKARIDMLTAQLARTIAQQGKPVTP